METSIQVNLEQEITQILGYIVLRRLLSQLFYNKKYSKCLLYNSIFNPLFITNQVLNISENSLKAMHEFYS